MNQRSPVHRAARAAVAVVPTVALAFGASPMVGVTPATAAPAPPAPPATPDPPSPDGESNRNRLRMVKELAQHLYNQANRDNPTMDPKQRGDRWLKAVQVASRTVTSLILQGKWNPTRWDEPKKVLLNLPEIVEAVNEVRDFFRKSETGINREYTRASRARQEARTRLSGAEVEFRAAVKGKTAPGAGPGEELRYQQAREELTKAREGYKKADDRYRWARSNHREVQRQKFEGRPTYPNKPKPKPDRPAPEKAPTERKWPRGVPTPEQVKANLDKARARARALYDPAKAKSYTTSQSLRWYAAQSYYERLLKTYKSDPRTTPAAEEHERNVKQELRKAGQPALDARRNSPSKTPTRPDKRASNGNNRGPTAKGPESRQRPVSSYPRKVRLDYTRPPSGEGPTSGRPKPGDPRPGGPKPGGPKPAGPAPNGGAAPRPQPGASRPAPQGQGTRPVGVRPPTGQPARGVSPPANPKPAVTNPKPPATNPKPAGPRLTPNSFAGGFARGFRANAVFTAAVIGLDRYYQHLQGERLQELGAAFYRNPYLASVYLKEYNEYQRMNPKEKFGRDWDTHDQWGYANDDMNPSLADYAQQILKESDKQQWARRNPVAAAEEARQSRATTLALLGVPEEKFDAAVWKQKAEEPGDLNETLKARNVTPDQFRDIMERKPDESDEAYSIRITEQLAQVGISPDAVERAMRTPEENKVYDHLTALGLDPADVPGTAEYYATHPDEAQIAKVNAAEQALQRGVPADRVPGTPEYAAAHPEAQPAQPAQPGQGFTGSLLDVIGIINAQAKAKEGFSHVTPYQYRPGAPRPKAPTPGTSARTQTLEYRPGQQGDRIWMVGNKPKAKASSSSEGSTRRDSHPKPDRDPGHDGGRDNLRDGRGDRSAPAPKPEQSRPAPSAPSAPRAPSAPSRPAPDPGPPKREPLQKLDPGPDRPSKPMTRDPSRDV